MASPATSENSGGAPQLESAWVLALKQRIADTEQMEEEQFQAVGKTVSSMKLMVGKQKNMSTGIKNDLCILEKSVDIIHTSKKIRKEAKHCMEEEC